MSLRIPAAALQQAVLGGHPLLRRRLSARRLLRNLSGLLPPAGRRAAPDRRAVAARPRVDAQVPVGARDRLLAAPPALDGGRGRRDGRRDALLRDAGRLRTDGMARDRRVHGALGDERRRDRRLHDRVSRQGRARARQRHTDRPLSRRHARLRIRADGLRMARLARCVRARGRRVLRAGGRLPLRSSRAGAHDAARQRARRARGAGALAVRARHPRGLRAGRAVADRRHDEVVRARRGLLGLRRRRRYARGGTRRDDRPLHSPAAAAARCSASRRLRPKRSSGGRCSVR